MADACDYGFVRGGAIRDTVRRGCARCVRCARCGACGGRASAASAQISNVL